MGGLRWRSILASISICACTASPPKNTFKATIPALQKSCEQGIDKACIDLGDAFWRGNVVEEDRDAAKGFYAKACERDHAEACRKVQLISAQIAAGVSSKSIAATASLPSFGGKPLYRPSNCRGYSSQLRGNDTGSAELRCEDNSNMYWVLPKALENENTASLEQQMQADAGVFLSAHDRSSPALVGGALPDADSGTKHQCRIDGDEGVCRVLRDAKDKTINLIGYRIGDRPTVYLQCSWIGEITSLPAACRHVVKVGDVIGGTARSRQQLHDSCTSGAAESCYELGLRWGNGEDGPASLVEARKWVKASCDRGHRPACEFLPLMAE